MSSDLRRDQEIPDKSRTQPASMMGDERGMSLGEIVLDFFTIITRWRRLIVWFVLIATVGTGIVALLSPKWYKSTASVFPADQANLFPGLEGVSSLVRNLSAGRRVSLTGPTEADRYIAILKSDRVLSAMIKKFDLMEIYEFEESKFPVEKTTKELLRNTEIEIQDEGNLTVSVYDKDPQRAADMANYYIDLLNETNSELLVQNARGNREFIEERYRQNLQDLSLAEEALKEFQLKHGVVAVPEQVQASIKTGAEIYGLLASKEVELNILKRTLSVDHPSITATEIEVQEMRRKLADMNAGGGSTDDDVKILVPFRQAPKLVVEYVRLYRNVEIQNKILQFITPLFEQAKVEERRNTPSVVVLDRAGLPERKAKPKITLYALLAFVVSTILALTIVFCGEAIKRVRDSNPDKYKTLIALARSDWFGLRWDGTRRGNPAKRPFE